MIAVAAGGAARVLVVGLLLVSGLEKLRSGQDFREVVRALGFRPATLWWLLLCGAEFSTAALMVIPLPSWWASAAVASLGLVFALAGGQAIRRGVDVKCACFGDVGGAARLGRRQIFALPAWLALAAAALLWAPTTVEHRTSVLLAAILAVTAGYAGAVHRATMRARADRTAMTISSSDRRADRASMTIDVPLTEIQRLGPIAAGAAAASKKPA